MEHAFQHIFTTKHSVNDIFTEINDYEPSAENTEATTTQSKKRSAQSVLANSHQAIIACWMLDTATATSDKHTQHRAIQQFTQWFR